MGKPICAVPLPPELQRELPAGALLYSFDGEVVFRSKNPNLNQEPRTYSLLPVTDNPLMYERRWPGNPIQDTFLAIEHFHGHTVTMFFFLLSDSQEHDLPVDAEISTDSERSSERGHEEIAACAGPLSNRGTIPTGEGV